MNRKARARGGVLLEPAGLGRAPQAPALFSTDPQRNHPDQPGIPREIKALPDQQLVATLVELGCPRWVAEQVRTHPGMRYAAVATWCLVRDAQEGKTVVNARTGDRTSARALVDAIREQYAQARKAELISEVPDHTIGLWER